MAQISPNRSRAPLQYAVMEQLCAFGRVSVQELCYFTGASRTTVRALAKKGLLTLEKQEVFRRLELPAAEEVPQQIRFRASGKKSDSLKPDFKASPQVPCRKM